MSGHSTQKTDPHNILDIFNLAPSGFGSNQAERPKPITSAAAKYAQDHVILGLRHINLIAHTDGR